MTMCDGAAAERPASTAVSLDEAEWPAAVEVLNPGGTSPVVLVCEHASRHMPSLYRGLGLGHEDLARHIAWDIGAAAVTRGLSRQIDAVAYLAGYSRLLIDLNRPLDAKSSIPERSEATDVPGNAGLAPDERALRAERMFRPFHERIAADLNTREAEGRPTRIVSIHSFNPVFLGKARPWHAGVLFDRSRALADVIMTRLAADGALFVAANEPYVVSREEDYALLVHGQDRGHDAVLIEIRNDLISDDAGVAEWIGRMSEALQA